MEQNLPPANDLPPTMDNGVVGRLEQKLRTYFFAGILVAAPVGVTIYIAWSIVTFVDDHITPLIPFKFASPSMGPINIPGLGLLVLIAGLTIIGAITTNVMGRVLIRAYDWIFARMPVIRGIYSIMKQMTEMLVGEKKTAYRQVVLVPFPNDTTWVMGFITGSSYAPVNVAAGDDMVSVFVPLPPNPTAGHLLYLPKSKIKPMPITVEEGWKLIISTGLVLPAANKGKIAS